MPGTSTIGLRYPVIADNNAVATDIQNLATDVDGFIQHQYTQAQINAFGAALKWPGRRVWNTTRTVWQMYDPVSAAFVDEAGIYAQVANAADYTLVLLDAFNRLIRQNSASANQVLIPTDASVAFPVNTLIPILQYGAGQTTVAAVTPGTTTLRSTPGAKLRAQYSTATLFKLAANEWLLSGDIVS